MKRNYLAFDIETAKIVSDSASSWRSDRPLGTTCIASLPVDCDEPRVWFKDDIIQEDPALLMYYDNAMMRIGE